LNSVAALSGLRVFGHGIGNPPKAVTEVKTSRTADELDADLSWDSVPGADGYNVRYGIAADKLYNSWQVFGKNELRLSFLNKGSDYFVAVDSFNENGVSMGEVIKVQ